MGILAECASAASMLPKLEPMAGAALAINLAYLNLDKFRYLTHVREHAREELGRLTGNKSDEQLPSNLRSTIWFLQVSQFAGWPTNDSEREAALREKCDVDMPTGLWWKIYTFVFSRHQDRLASYVFTAGALIALIVGTAHAVNHWTWANCAFSGGWEIYWLYFLSAAVGMPVVFVYWGGRMVRWCKRYATQCVQGMENLLKSDVGSAPLPTLDDLLR